MRRVLEYGISEINPDKILMGVPNYGYDWRIPFVQGESRAERLSNPEAVARAGIYGVEIQYDEIAQAPFFRYTDAEGNNHIVWFEDYRSWNAKFQLLKELGLAGFSIWNLMSPFLEGRAAIRDNFEVSKF
ncbi:MAG: glycosyl hydrolase family 18 protein [Eubacteriales bacterium]|nr:glycosyl hydrolase family 18 protein [Eubacteriales bacterium]